MLLACVVPTTMLAMPPTAARTFAAPTPKGTLRPGRPTGYAALTAHVMPATVVASAHKGRGLRDEPLPAQSCAPRRRRGGEGGGHAGADKQGAHCAYRLHSRAPDFELVSSALKRRAAPSRSSRRASSTRLLQTGLIALASACPFLLADGGLRIPELHAIGSCAAGGIAIVGATFLCGRASAATARHLSWRGCIW